MRAHFTFNPRISYRIQQFNSIINWIFKSNLLSTTYEFNRLNLIHLFRFHLIYLNGLIVLHMQKPHCVLHHNKSNKELHDLSIRYTLATIRSLSCYLSMCKCVRLFSPGFLLKTFFTVTFEYIVSFGSCLHFLIPDWFLDSFDWSVLRLSCVR